MFSKRYGDRNRGLMFSQYGNNSFKNLLQEKKGKNNSLQNYKTFNANLFNEELNLSHMHP